MITATDKIRIILKRLNLTVSDLARMTGQTKQNLGNKMNRGNLRESDIREIAEALNCKVSIIYVLPNGEEI